MDRAQVFIPLVNAPLIPDWWQHWTQPLIQKVKPMRPYLPYVSYVYAVFYAVVMPEGHLGSSF